MRIREVDEGRNDDGRTGVHRVCTPLIASSPTAEISEISALAKSVSATARKFEVGSPYSTFYFTD
jgi:hypothetical protein